MQHGESESGVRIEIRANPESAIPGSTLILILDRCSHPTLACDFHTALPLLSECFFQWYLSMPLPIPKNHSTWFMIQRSPAVSLFLLALFFVLVRFCLLFFLSSFCFPFLFLFILFLFYFSFLFVPCSRLLSLSLWSYKAELALCSPLPSLVHRVSISVADRLVAC